MSSRCLSSAPRCPWTIAALLAAAALAACHEGPTGLFSGAVNVLVVRGGHDVDASGYSVRVDGGPLRLVHGDNLIVDDLAPRRHLIEIHGPVENCSVAGDNPRQITVSPSDTVPVTFEVVCVQRQGTLRITTETTGSDLDADGYLVAVGEAAVPAPVNGLVEINHARAGFHSVTLRSVDRNCTVVGDNSRMVNVPYASSVDIVFRVSCVPSGTLRVVTAMSGQHRDPNGYDLRVTGPGLDTGVSMSAAGTLEIPRLLPGQYVATVGALAIHCRTAARQADVAAGATTTATIDIACGTPVVFAAHSTPGDSEILLLASHLEDPIWLTSNDAWDGEPAWSPNGRQIVFESNREGTTTLFVMNADGSNQRRLAPLELQEPGRSWHEPAWSPDGTRIAFRSMVCPPTCTGSLFVIDADGSNPRQVSSELGNVSGVSWSPDGRRIAFASDRDGPSAIFVIDLTSLEVVKLTGSAAMEDYEPAWSPSGTHIAYTRYEEDDQFCSARVMIMRADGSDARGLAYCEWSPAWSPDGSTIALLSPFADGPVLYDLDGAFVDVLPSIFNPVASPAWAPAGAPIPDP